MTHPHKAHTGVQRIVHAASYSLAGLSAAWRHESAFRQECMREYVNELNERGPFRREP